MSPLVNEPVVRLACYAGVLVAVGLAEFVWPRRQGAIPRARRWPGNLLVAALGTLLVRVVLPAGLIGVSLAAEQRGFGLLNRMPAPAWAAFVGSIVALDLTLYTQHVLFHKIPLLWRVHCMHHTDLHVDVTTGVRFHPIELVLSLGIKAAAVAALGAPPAAVLAFEVLLNATAMFNHGNLGIPSRIDGLLRLFVVTPDMHRVHHSIDRAETDTNFGFNVPWWDRLFGTYRAAPALGHDAMQLGLPEFREPQNSRLDSLLLQPLRHRQERY